MKNKLSLPISTGLLALIPTEERPMLSIITRVFATVLCLSVVVPAEAALATYTDRTSWEAAAGTIETDTFTGAIYTPIPINTVFDVGLFNVFYTTSGGVTNSNYISDISDHLRLEIDTNGSDTTTLLQFQFDTPITAFGADFDRIDSTDDLTFTPNIGPESVNIYDVLGGGSGFLGITSDSAFISLSFTAEGRDAFYLDNVSLASASVPIPAAVWLFGSGLLGFIGLGRRKKAT